MVEKAWLRPTWLQFQNHVEIDDFLKKKHPRGGGPFFLLTSTKSHHTWVAKKSMAGRLGRSGAKSGAQTPQGAANVDRGQAEKESLFQITLKGRPLIGLIYQRGAPTKQLKGPMRFYVSEKKNFTHLKMGCAYQGQRHWSSKFEKIGKKNKYPRAYGASSGRIPWLMGSEFSGASMQSA